MPVVISENVQEMNDADFIKKQNNEILEKIGALADARPSVDPQPKLNEPVGAWEWVKRIGGILGILVAFFGILTYIISAEFDRHISPVKQDIVGQIGLVRENVSSLGSRIEGVEKRQDRIDAKEFPALLTAPPPKTTEKLEEYLKEKGEIATTAKLRQISIDPKFVSDAAQQTLAVDASKPQFAKVAWDTTTALLNYNSFLASLTPVPGIDNAKPFLAQAFNTSFFIQHEDPKGKPEKVQWVGIAPHDHMAHLDYIGRDQNANQVDGPRTLLITGGDIILDGADARHTVFINTKVYYKGGKVILNDVYFINCVFQIEHGSNGRDLISSLFDLPQIKSFSIS